MKKHSIDALNEIYTEADNTDQTIFAEMRSNLLLVAGEHYAKKGSKFWNRIRDSKALNDEQKIRLTRNHVQKIQKTYSNYITSACPGVTISPDNEKELEDQKAAELHQAVWRHRKRKVVFDEKVADWADDFTGIGEVATKIFFNPNKGDLKGYEQEVDDEGNPVYTDPEGNDTTEPHSVMPDGQMQAHQLKASDRPVFRGQIEYETLYAFNLLRHAASKSHDESPLHIVRKMAEVDEVKESIPTDDPDREKKTKWIQATADQTFVVFEAQKNSYEKSKGKVMLREYYFKPCFQYPMGYFFITVQEGILFEGELPFGIYPIVVDTYDKIQTSARGISPIRTMRPYQIEINRAASKIAEHHVTLGDDKLIMMAGSKLSQGTAIPGVRALEVSGMAPTVMAGRDGSQYLPWMQQNITELYDVMMVNEMGVEKDGQLDPYAMLFKSASQKQKFQKPIKRFERFLTKVCEVSMELERNYIQDDELIPAIGREEYVNIAEFRNSNKLCYQIKVEPQAEDVESKLGKQLVLNHALQYVGQKLDKEDIGKLLRVMPYGNFEESFSDLTIDYDSGTNMILALDRGEVPEPNKFDTKPYMVKRLTARMRMPSFKQLDPTIQSNFENLVAEYEQMIADEQQQIMAAQADYIPTGGYLVVVDFYVSDPADPNKTRRARLPYEAIAWLVKRLEQQGSSLQQLEQMQQGALADIASIHNGQQQMNSQIPAMGGPGGMRPGAEMPARGVSHGTGNPIDREYRLNTFDPRLIGAATSPV
jgi:hypothetical protein